jgi:hypothetical protein
MAPSTRKLANVSVTLAAATGAALVASAPNARADTGPDVTAPTVPTNVHVVDPSQPWYEATIEWNPSADDSAASRSTGSTMSALGTVRSQSRQASLWQHY